MRLRRATPEDHGPIGAVTIAAYEEFLLGAEDDYRHRLLDTAGRDREAELWVATAEDSNEILGTVTICPEGSPWRELAEEGQGEFRMLAVSPAARRRGVGEALTQMVVDRLRAQGATSIVMSSLSEMAGAHRLYGRLGFERAPELDWHPVPEVSLIAFRLELG
ncbi:MAG: GNAT family N-acetyltransferase [Nocardioides sp.]